MDERKSYPNDLYAKRYRHGIKAELTVVRELLEDLRANVRTLRLEVLAERQRGQPEERRDVGH